LCPFSAQITTDHNEGAPHQWTAGSLRAELRHHERHRDGKERRTDVNTRKRKKEKYNGIAQRAMTEKDGDKRDTGRFCT
jgi:hypothetical protein